MGRKHQPGKAEASKFRAASLRFARWRKSRQGNGRIPVPLWDLATELGLEFGVSRTVGALGLGYEDLKKRVLARGGAREESKKVSFFEMPTFSGPVLPEFSMELEDDRGYRLKLALKGGALPDMVEITRVFTGEER